MLFSYLAMIQGLGNVCGRALPATTRVPSLTTDEVTAGGPFHTVLAAGLVGVGDVRAAVGPPRVVVPVVGTSAAGGSGTSEELAGDVCGEGKSSRHAGERDDEGREGDHNDDGEGDDSGWIAIVWKGSPFCFVLFGSLSPSSAIHRSSCGWLHRSWARNKQGVIAPYLMAPPLVYKETS